MANLPYTRLQLRRGDKSWWTSNNPILAEGEPGVEIDKTSGKTKVKMKIGDGSTPWNDLKYMSGSGSGGSGILCELKCNKSILEYNSQIPELTFNITVSGDYDSCVFSYSNKTIEIADIDDSGKKTFTINDLGNIKNNIVFKLSLKSDNTTIAESSVTVYPGYYIYYKVSDDLDSNLSNYKKIGPYVSADTSILTPTQTTSGAGKLYIAVNKNLKVIFRDPNGYVMTPYSINESLMVYNNSSVQYSIYQIGNVGIEANTNIKLSSKE